MIMGDSLQSSFWFMVAVQTLGAVDLPGFGDRKMPSPRNYVAIVVAWLVLNIVSSFGQGARRAAAAMGWLLVLTGMVVGPFGQQFTNFLSNIAARYAVTTPTTAATQSTSPEGGASQ